MRGLSETLAGLIGRPLGDAEPVAVAVSGGPDSLALLCLARDALGDRVRALTVDHGLREASAAEAAHVAGISRDLGVPHRLLRWDGEKPTANIQAAAREARYRLMADWCADNGVGWLLTAHHADDQAETLMLRLARGAGLGGLAGIRPRRSIGPGVVLLRPLLAERRAELAAIAARAGLAPIDDPTNRDPRYDRTRAREWLGQQAALDPAQLAASAAHLADAEAALAWTAERAWTSRAAVGEQAIEIDAQGLPRELQRRLLLRAFEAFGAADPRGPDLDRLLERVAAGRAATLGGIAIRPGAIWRLAKTPPRRSGAAAR